jgi:hypothetical protein
MLGRRNFPGALPGRTARRIVCMSDQETAMPEPVTVFTPPKSPPVNPSPAVPEFRSSPVRSAAIADGTRSNPLQSEPEKRWAADQAAILKERPWADPSLLITKDADGTIRTRPRNGQQSGGTPADAGTAPQPGTQQTAPQAQPGPASVTDGGELVVGDLKLSAADIKGLMERHALEQSRRANTPATADAFMLDLPEDFVLPPNTAEFKFDLENPVSAAAIGQLKEYAKSVGLSQPEFSRLLGIYAGHQVSEAQRFAAAQKSEIGKLGVNAPTRVDAVSTFLESQVGSELARALRSTMFTAESVRAYEALMQRFVSQGVGGAPGASRDGGEGREPGKLSDADYAKLSYHEKIQYAQGFRQT